MVDGRTQKEMEDKMEYRNLAEAMCKRCVAYPCLCNRDDKIRAETRQECWDDLQGKLDFSESYGCEITGFYILLPAQLAELKKKWGRK